MKMNYKEKGFDNDAYNIQNYYFSYVSMIKILIRHIKCAL